MNTETKISGPHSRADWFDMRSDEIFVCARFDAVKNGGGGDRGTAKTDRDAYIAAKHSYDHDAAAKIVYRYFTDRVIDRVIDELMPDLTASKRICIVHPQPCFNVDGERGADQIVTNALPYACAALLADELDADLTKDIIQIARPGRTKLSKWQRFLYQPKFEGSVDSDATYVLIDDNCTLGGTLAMLRTHIVSNGGTVGAVCTLCSPDGVDRRFSVTKETLSAINSAYGVAVDKFLLEEIGHETFQFTENEGLSLKDWDAGDKRIPLLDRLREKIRATRAGSEQ